MKAGNPAKLLIGAVLFAALAGCGGFSLGKLNPWGGAVEESRRFPADATAYSCDKGKTLVLRQLPGANAVMVIFPEREFRLDQTTDGQGKRYSNGRMTLNSTGDEVFLEEEGAMIYSGCKKSAGERGAEAAAAGAARRDGVARGA